MPSGGGGGGSTTSTSSTVTQPWSGQEPYLTSAFQDAQNLYNGSGPQYYGGQQIASMTPNQTAGLGAITQQATTGEPITSSTSNFDTALQGGSYFGNAAPGQNSQSTLNNLQDSNYTVAQNPGIDMTMSGATTADNYLAGSLANGGATANPYSAELGNLATNALSTANTSPGSLSTLASGQMPGSLNTLASGQMPGSLGTLASGQMPGSLNTLASGQMPGSLSAIANGASVNNPYNYTLQPIAEGAAATDNPANSLLGGLASGSANASNPAMPALMSQSMGGGAGSNTLNEFSSGDLLSAGNPYSQQAIASMAAGVIPQAEAAFTGGGAVNNPAMAYAASQGLGAAISPMIQSEYQQGLTQMQSSAEQQANTQTSAATAAGSQYLTGTGQQATAAQDIGQNFLGGYGLATQAGQDLSTNYLTGTGQALQASQNTAQNTLEASQDTAQNTLGASQDTAQNALSASQYTAQNALSASQDVAQNTLGASQDIAQNTLGAEGLAGSLTQNQAQDWLSGFGANTQAATAMGATSNAAGSTLSNAYLGGLGVANQAASEQQNAYQGTLNNMTQSLMTAPSIQNMSYTDANNLYNAGSTQQQYDQSQINAAIQQWNYNQTLPYNQLSNFLGNVGGGMYGSTAIQTTPYQNSALGNALGTGFGVAAGGQALSQMAGYSSLFGSGNSMLGSPSSW